MTVYIIVASRPRPRPVVRMVAMLVSVPRTASFRLYPARFMLHSLYDRMTLVLGIFMTLVVFPLSRSGGNSQCYH